MALQRIEEVEWALELPDGAVGLEPIGIVGVTPRTEQAEDNRHLCWGPLSEDQLAFGERKAIKGIWLRWEGPNERARTRVWVSFEGIGDAPLAPLIRLRWGPRPPVSRFLSTVVHEGADRRVLLELAPGWNHELLLADLRDFPLYAEAPRLRADPDDREPLGGRTPVIVTHGLLWDSPHVTLSGVAAPIFFNALRRHERARRLSDRVKWYAFDYPAWRHPAENGAGLSSLAREMLEAEDARGAALLVGHSLGGVVARHAMNVDDFGEAVALAVCAGSPHRGTLFTSLGAATGDLQLDIPRADLGLLARWSGYIMPDCPGSRATFWDNFDGAFDRPDRAAYRLPTNPELARFNEEDAYLDRLLCVAGDCKRLGIHRWVSPHERLRWAQERYFPGFENTDPFVPLASAAFEGAPVRRSIHAGADHLGWALWPWQVSLLLEHLESAL